MIMNFIAIMLLHPGVQKKAQAEIDTIIGSSRLPDFSDRPSLPYVECVMYETMRQVSCFAFQAMLFPILIRASSGGDLLPLWVRDILLSFPMT